MMNENDEMHVGGTVKFNMEKNEKYIKVTVLNLRWKVRIYKKMFVTFYSTLNKAPW